MNSNKLKRVAWISYPDLISTDRFIIPEISKKYAIDWYLLAKKTDHIDFLDDIKKMSDQGLFSLKIQELSTRNITLKALIDYYKIIKAIKNESYDIHFLIMMAPPYFMPLWKLIIGRINTVVGIHNVIVPKGAVHYFAEKLYTSFTITSFKYFHTFSKSQYSIFKKIAPSKECGFSNFIAMDYGMPREKRENSDITFLSFGYIRDYKRIDCLINAAQTAFERTKVNFRVIIAGSCSDWSKYQELIKYPQLFDLKIHRIYDNEVADLFCETDYFVAPYQDIAQSGSAIIAVNYGIPVIASKLEAFEEYIEDGVNGYLIRPANEDDLTNVIINILHNHDKLYSRLHDSMLRVKNNEFSPSAVSNMYEKTLDMINKNRD